MSAERGGPSNTESRGPPYAPATAQLGGQPTVALDDPICAVLLGLYVAGAATHMVIFQINRNRDHKFIFSVLLFGFCMARITTLSLRIAWASLPGNTKLAIAANIFVQAGVLLLFIVNLIFAQRIVRSYHPRLGWSRGLSWAFRFLYLCVVAMLAMVITAAVDSFYTLDISTRLKDRDVLLVAGTFLAFLAFLPVPVVLLTVITPRTQRPEKFGIGRFRTKLTLLLSASLILTVGACFRLAVNFTTPRPRDDPAWYHSKACFYCFNFVIELAVVYAYAIARFDRRFHVPDRSSGPGHYSGSRVESEKPEGWRPSSMGRASFEANRQGDVFDGEADYSEMQSRRESEWEARATKELNKVPAVEEHV